MSPSLFTALQIKRLQNWQYQIHNVLQKQNKNGHLEQKHDLSDLSGRRPSHNNAEVSPAHCAELHTSASATPDKNGEEDMQDIGA